MTESSRDDSSGGNTTPPPPVPRSDIKPEEGRPSGGEPITPATGIDNSGFTSNGEPKKTKKKGDEGDIKENRMIDDIRECCDGGCRVWCKKYFWEGQTLVKSQTVAMLVTQNAENLPKHKVFLVRHRRLIGLIIPGLFVNFFWLAVMIHYNLWHYFVDSYFLSITMVFGSMVAGMTSLGGATIAFPVMTLAFKIPPSVARDFGVCIQSFGMGCAAFTINFMKVQIEKKAVILGSLGGMTGIIFGLHLVDPFMSAAEKKLVFASTLFSFASVLLLLNCQRNRKTFDQIPNFRPWKAITLLVTGFIGGTMTSFAGCGLDVSCFSVMTLLFRVSEKVATPTAVILMAGNSMVGAFWRWAIIEGLQPVSIEYLAVCIPIVIIGAPLGAVLGSHFHRLVTAVLIIIIDVVTLVAALVIIPLNGELIGLCVGIIAGACLIFTSLTYCGSRMISSEEKDVKEKAPDLVHTNADKGYSSFL